MTLVSVLAFENLSTQDFWDGADDRTLISDMAILSQDLSHIVSEERLFDARPPFDLFMLGGYLLWGENPAAYHIFHIFLHLLASLLAAFTFHRLHIDLELCLFASLLFLVNVTHFRAVHWITCIRSWVLTLGTKSPELG
jgi:hypothetical protein